MRHRKAYTYINFYQTRLSRSVKTVHTNQFAKNHRLHKFATTNSNFYKKLSLSDIHHRKTYMYINFQQNRVGSQNVHTNYLQKNANCINLQLAIRILKNHAFLTCTTP